MNSYYEHLLANDVLSLAEPLLSVGYNLRDADGKIHAQIVTAWDTPWQHVYHSGQLDCQTWHRILFDVIFKKRFVPSHCQSCWKVVVRPKTLFQLFALLELQKKLMVPSKCGIEVREYVHGLYGGYFYTGSLEAGRERWAQVRGLVDSDPNLGPDVNVILKRACTEFEMACGPSDQWAVTDEQMVMEELVDKFFVRDVQLRSQPEHVITKLHRKWIEFAYANGDSTYKEFTNGKPLYPGYVTYHASNETAGDVGKREPGDNGPGQE